MKRTLASLLLLCLLVPLTSCRAEGGNTLFDTVSTEGSPLSFHIYDETYRDNRIYNEALSRLLEEMRGVPVTLDRDWTPSDVTLPIYGFSATKTNGKQFAIAFSGGRAITQDGIAYFFDYDFSRLESRFDWAEEWTEGISDAGPVSLPCAPILLIENNTWRHDLMKPAGEQMPVPPDGISAEPAAWNGADLTVTLRNASTQPWEYGDSFRAEVCIAGVWYPIPRRMTEYPVGFHLVAYGLLPDMEVEKTYNVYNLYGFTPAGRYRIVTNGLAVEYEVE